MAHPTDMSLVLIGSGNDMLILDICAHLPQIVPSLGVPSFLKNTEVFEGVFNVFQNDQLFLVINRSSSSYTIYNIENQQVIANRTAVDVILGNGGRHTELTTPILRRRSGDDSKDRRITMNVYDNEKLIRTILTPFPEDFSFAHRLVSLGELFAVIVGVRPLDLSCNPQRSSRTTCLIYKWDTLEPIALHFDGVSLLTCDPPNLAVASQNSYAVFDTEQQMRRKVHRQKRVFSMKFFEKKLYLLTPDGLEIDDFRRIALFSGRFSHLITVDRNAPLIPVNALKIETIRNGTVTVVDTVGNVATIGIPEEDDNCEQSVLVEVAQAPQPIVAASVVYDAGVKEEEVKQLLLLLSNQMGWDPVDAWLSESERAVAELTANEGDYVLQNEFNDFVVSELEIERL
jgi:hypothetical protein